MALDNNPTAQISYTQANKVDPQLQYLSIWSELYPKEGLMSGDDYLMYTIDKGCCITIAPTVVFRRSAFDLVGRFLDELCYNSFDFNMWIRIANRFDIYFIKQILVNYRLHDKQMSKEHWFTKGYPTGRLATMFELIKACCLKLEDDEIKNDPEKQNYLLRKISLFNKQASEYARTLIAGL